MKPRARGQQLMLRDAIIVKSAELWLEVGQPVQALLELQRLTKRAWKHPWTQSVFVSAGQAMAC